MPAYSKTNWVDGSVPAIDATNLNKIEQGIFDSLRQDGSTTMSGQLVTTAGSAATPAIAPTGDANTGIFFPSADTIAFGEGGAEAMRINSSGQVGIGTTTPTEKLQVNATSGNVGLNINTADAGAVSYLSLSNTGASGKRYSLNVGGNTIGSGLTNNLFLYDNDNAAVRFLITPSGNVGIGTTSPQSILHVTDMGLFSKNQNGPNELIGAYIGNDGSYATLDMRRWTGTGTNHGTGKIQVTDTAAMIFYTDTKSTNTASTTERMRLTSAGNLLIGTTTDYTSTVKNGSVTIDGIATRDVILTTGLSGSLQNVGFIIQNSTPFSGGNGSTSNGIYGMSCSPVISNDASGGTSQIFAHGVTVAPVLSSSSVSARIALFGGNFAANRSSANDFSTNAANILIGNQSSANHSITLPATVVTNNAVGFQATSANLSGTMTSHTAIQGVLNVANLNTSQASTSPTSNAFSSSITVGSTSGGIGTVTNAYGYRISTITVNNTGTITNLYGLHIPTPTITGAGVITNKWAIYTTDANMPSSHAGYFLIGYTASNGAYPLQVNGQIFATSSTIATSDGRYKKDIVALDGALDIVKALNPVQFSWKDHPVHKFNTDVPTVGFIAQEVEQALVDKSYLTSIIKKSECTWETETGETIEREVTRDVEKQVTREVEREVTETIDGEEVTRTVTEEITETIIEQVTEIVTEPVKETHTEEFLGIAESNLIAILTKAVQELTAKVEALEAQLNK